MTHGLWPTRLLCPWDFSGRNTGVSCHFLLQGIYPGITGEALKATILELKKEKKKRKWDLQSRRFLWASPGREYGEQWGDQVTRKSQTWVMPLPSCTGLPPNSFIYSSSTSRCRCRFCGDISLYKYIIWVPLFKKHKHIFWTFYKTQWPNEYIAVEPPRAGKGPVQWVASRLKHH